LSAEREKGFLSISLTLVLGIASVITSTCGSKRKKKKNDLKVIFFGEAMPFKFMPLWGDLHPITPVRDSVGTL
jgi:hypothetical protein